MGRGRVSLFDTAPVSPAPADEAPPQTRPGGSPAAARSADAVLAAGRLCTADAASAAAETAPRREGRGAAGGAAGASLSAARMMQTV